MGERWFQTVVTGCFTAILVGYFVVWLPQPVAGLSFIGLELGEWVKFLPQFRSGEMVVNRNIFYLSPITLGLMIITWTASWKDGRWQTWIVRILAIAVAFLAFPSLEAIIDEPAGEWLVRSLLVALVILLALLAPFSKRLSANTQIRASWFIIFILGLVGGILPTWAFLEVRGPAGDIIQADIGIGPGVWLNALGHFLLAATAVYYLRKWAGNSSQTLTGLGQ